MTGDALDPRPPWSREKFYEGDLRTYWSNRETLGPGADSPMAIPTRVANHIAEILDLYVFVEAANLRFTINGIEFSTTALLNGPIPIPVHLPAANMNMHNYHGSNTIAFNWGIRYRRKVPYRED